LRTADAAAATAGTIIILRGTGAIADRPSCRLGVAGAAAEAGSFVVDVSAALALAAKAVGELGNEAVDSAGNPPLPTPMPLAGPIDGVGATAAVGERGNAGAAADGTYEDRCHAGIPVVVAARCGRESVWPKG
jgi:hypothetical protein